MGLLLSIQDALVGALWLGTPIERIVKPVVHKALTHTPDRCLSHAQCRLYLGVRPVRSLLATIGFEQDVGMHDLSRCAGSRCDEMLQAHTLLFA